MIKKSDNIIRKMNNKSIIYNITNSKRIFKSKSHESIDNCSSIVKILIF